MINTRIDPRELIKTLDNIVDYSSGFTKGITKKRTNFNRQLGSFIEDALYKYVDAKARANPEALHHIYEWGMTGNPTGRLFELSMSYTQRSIYFASNFLQSNTTSKTSTEPFSEKAQIMESGLQITITPRNSDVLAFEDDGEMVFTSGSVTIENPGGEAVAGSFEKVVKDFFENYLVVGLLRGSGLFDRLSYPKEYVNSFSQGAKTGESTGISAGMRYLDIGGIEVQ
jgi:hypothetical protein